MLRQRDFIAIYKYNVQAYLNRQAHLISRLHFKSGTRIFSIVSCLNYPKILYLFLNLALSISSLLQGPTQFIQVVNFIEIKTMSTELKYRRPELDSPPEQKSTPLQQEFIGYHFLRNIWGTYFHQRHDASTEQQLDSINKIVGMMKAQVRLMILSQNKSCDHASIEREKQELEQFHKMQTELEQTKEALQRSKMHQQELLDMLAKQGERIGQLESENNKLKEQVGSLKESKNRVAEQVIDLSKRIYELERYDPQMASEPSFLEQYSAITIDHESEPKPRVSLFNRKDSASIFNLCDDSKSLHSEEEPESTNQNDVLNQLNLNLPLKAKNVMKQSLQCYYQEEANEKQYCDFLEEMKRVKLKTERILYMESENSGPDRKYLHHRRTFDVLTERPRLEPSAEGKKEKRFKRIR